MRPYVGVPVSKHPARWYHCEDCGQLTYRRWRPGRAKVCFECALERARGAQRAAHEYVLSRRKYVNLPGTVPLPIEEVG